MQIHTVLCAMLLFIAGCMEATATAHLPLSRPVTPLSPVSARNITLENHAVPVGSQAKVATSKPQARSAAAVFVWPAWAHTARIAGAYFAPDNSDAEIDASLNELITQHVSVVLADSPWGVQYSASVDDAQFAPVKALVAKVVQKAHARGLKVVMYQTGLELLSDAKRNPYLEHAGWAQESLDGKPILFNDISNQQEHWLDTGVWDFWLSPCQGGTGTFQKLAFARVREMVTTGIDGLWVDEVYLPSSVGSHDNMWPSSDPCSAAAFKTATGLNMPTIVNWDDPTFRRWIAWRHTEITDFLSAEKEVARAVNPNLVFLNENSSADTGRSTYVADDPASYLSHPDMTTGHEIETIADRMDEGETGMQAATLDQWLAFRTMVAFARSVDQGKPSWVLTYGYQPRDSAQLAGIVLSEGANFYETKGPQMADTAGKVYRTQLFNWIATHEAPLYGGDSLAEVGLLYSPRTRDLLDTVSGETYDVQDSTHFAAYRAAANWLYRAHVPFNVVIDTNTNAFPHYRVLIAPELQAMSDATAAALHQFTGKLITIGDTGKYDEWLNERSSNALADMQPLYYAKVDKSIVAAANTHLLTTTAPSTAQLGLRQTGTGYSVIFVNAASTPIPAFTLDLRLTSQITAAHFSRLDGQAGEVHFTQQGINVHLEVPAGIDTVALLTLTATKAPNGATLNDRSWLPVVTH